MKKFLIMIITAILLVGFVNPKPANAGGNKGLVIGGALLGGFLLGSVLNSHDRIIVGPVYPSYPLPVYYPPPVYYPSPPVRWIPDHYEFRWVTTCQTYRYPYPYQNCYQHQITVFIPGQWGY